MIGAGRHSAHLAPWRCAKVFVVLGAALIALGVFAEASMSRGYDGAPTKAGWAEAANAICNRANVEIMQLPVMTSLPVAVTDMRVILAIAETAHEQIAAIPRPPAELARIRALLAKEHRARAIYGNQITALSDKHPTQAVRTAYRHRNTELDTLNTSYNATARSLGARVCALNPRPGGGGTVQ